MTFYEAALRLLESAGQPLHVRQITEQAVQQSLLSHVGKMPEQTMLSRLAAMARRKGERRIVVTAKDTFGLIEWSVPEDPEALAQTGLAEPNPEEDLPPLRAVERHPEARADNVRSVGRGPERRRRRDDDEERPRRRRYPPVSEVVFELLSDKDAGLPADELVALAKERELAGDELTDEVLLTALLEDNQRRIDAERRPQFILQPENRVVSLERAGSPTEAPPLELQAAFAAALGIPLEGGRAVMRRASERADGAEQQQVQAAKAVLKDARRAMARVLRRRLMDLDAGTLERAAVRMLHGLHFRDLKVAKRSKEGPLLTGRRREGSLELRYAVRVLRGGATIDRRAVQDVRRDLGHHSAHLGLLLSPAEARGEAKSEALGGGGLVLLWCAEALAEKFFEAKVGVFVHSVETFDIDDRFFDQARFDADEARARREERHREKEARRHQDDLAEPGSPEEASVGAPLVEAEVEFDDAGEGGDAEEGDSGDELGTAGEGQATAGERKRRRRRRRGRRGRGRAPEGGPTSVEGSGPAAAAGGAASGPELPTLPVSEPSPSDTPPSPAGGDAS